MDQDRKEQNHQQKQRDEQQNNLQVLIELDVHEGPEDSGAGWQVAVVEHLRLHVPTQAQQAWLEAELQTWDPWLRQQKGFWGREVLWDRDRQEGVLLIHWASREDWQSISMQVVASIQQDFESVAKQVLALPPHSQNPFPLIHAGETTVS